MSVKLNEDVKASIEAIEGTVYQSDIDTPRNNDPMWWRKMIFSLKTKKESLDQLTTIQNDILQKYQSEIEKKKADIEYMEGLLKNSLENSQFKTKTGGFKMDLFPDLGVAQIKKPTLVFKPSDDYKDFWLGKFKRVKQSEEFDKSTFNKFVKESCAYEDGQLIDKETGQIIEGIEVEERKNFSFVTPEGK